MSMFRSLLARHIVGGAPVVPAVPTTPAMLAYQGLNLDVIAGGSTYLTKVDELVSGAGPNRHYRLNETGGAAFVDRKGTGANGAQSSSILTRADTPLVVDDVGGGSVGAKGTSWVEIPNLIDGVNFTLLLTVVFDGTPSNTEVLAASPDQSVPGSWAFEVNPDGSLRLRRRNATDSTTCVTAAGLVTPYFDGTPVQLGYSNAATGERFRAWVAGAKHTKPFGQQDDDYPPGDWIVPPTGVCVIGAQNVSGSLPFSGLIAEVIEIDHAIANSEVVALSAEPLPGVAWLDPSTIDFGDVSESTATAKSINPYTHPEGAVATITTPPSVGSVAPNGAGSIMITGHSSPVDGTTFSLEVTANGATSLETGATFDTTGAPPTEPVVPPTPNLSDPVYARASGSLAPNPSGDRAYGRADGSLAPNEDTNDPAFSRE